MNYLGKSSTKTDISKMWIDMEQHIPKSTWKGQEHNQEEGSHGFLQWKGSIIPRNRCIACRSRSKSYTSDGHKVVLKKVSTWNAVLKPIAFASKSLTSAESCYSRKRSAGNTTWSRKLHPYCFAWRKTWSQTTNYWLQYSGKMLQVYQIGFKE